MDTCTYIDLQSCTLDYKKKQNERDEGASLQAVCKNNKKLIYFELVILYTEHGQIGLKKAPADC